MKVGVAQFDPTIGDFAGNGERLLAWIGDAKRAGCDLIVFPELAVCGYPPRDLLYDSSFVRQNRLTLERLAAAAQGIVVVCGFVDVSTEDKGRELRNSAAVMVDGQVTATYHKRLLPYYDVFDEQRHFEPGSEPCVFEVNGKRVALTLCEDLWNEPGFIRRPYAQYPLQDVAAAHPDLVLNLSASPFSLGKPQMRIALFQEVARRVGAPILCVGQVGANDDLIFDGASVAVDPQGNVRLRAPAFEETLIFWDTDGTQDEDDWPRTEEAWITGALTLGLREYVRKCSARGVCLGLSGGVDSSVAALLAVEALGSSAVRGVALPTRYSSRSSVADATSLAKALGISFSVFPIEGGLEWFEKSLGESWGHPPTGVTLENLQPRLRMITLMAIANDEGRMLLNTSNKSEIACGYATLYGDTAGALALLGDLTKTQVYALGRHLNAKYQAIPEGVFSKAPSAELKENQKTEEALMPFSILDGWVRELTENYRSPRDLERSSATDESALSRVARLLSQSEYKRRQFPPILRVSWRSFGMGWRVPIAAKRPEP